MTSNLLTFAAPQNYEGYVVLDYESWRANWGWTNQPYRTASVALASAANPSLKGAALTATAELQYNNSAMRFLIATLRTIRKARPKLRGLGMYDYPLGLCERESFAASFSFAHVLNLAHDRTLVAAL
eukprot:SAG11_NODE_1282_length_5310_cov_24.980426_2_plen_127_part_00